MRWGLFKGQIHLAWWWDAATSGAAARRRGLRSSGELGQHSDLGRETSRLGWKASQGRKKSCNQLGESGWWEDTESQGVCSEGWHSTRSAHSGPCVQQPGRASSMTQMGANLEAGNGPRDKQQAVRWRASSPKPCSGPHVPQVAGGTRAALGQGPAPPARLTAEMGEPLGGTKTSR